MFVVNATYLIVVETTERAYWAKVVYDIEDNALAVALAGEVDGEGPVEVLRDFIRGASSITAIEAVRAELGRQGPARSMLTKWMAEMQAMVEK